MYFMMRGASSRRAASIVSAVADGAKVPARATESARAAPALNEFHDELGMAYFSKKVGNGIHETSPGQDLDRCRRRAIGHPQSSRHCHPADLGSRRLGS